MPIKRPFGPPGRLAVLEHTSKVLQGNALGDPHVRPLHVWLPPQYDRPEFAEQRFPVLYDLVGFTGSGPSHTNWKNFGENVPERAARLIHQKKMAPAIIVFPDCFTALGGNQYINSSAIGRYADYLVDELIPFVDSRFRTLASREHRAAASARARAATVPSCTACSTRSTGARWPTIRATPISTSSTCTIGRTRSIRSPSSPRRSAGKGRST